nr:hypothetical protein [Pandoravirus belohorizontensis]
MTAAALCPLLCLYERAALFSFFFCLWPSGMGAGELKIFFFQEHGQSASGECFFLRSMPRGPTVYHREACEAAIEVRNGHHQKAHASGPRKTSALASSFFCGFVFFSSENSAVATKELLPRSDGRPSAVLATVQFLKKTHSKKNASDG